MAHPPIIILGYSEAGMLLARGDRPDIEAAISIRDPHQEPLDLGTIPHQLPLVFSDVAAIPETDSVEAARIRRHHRKMAENGREVIAPRPEHARAIVTFAMDIAGISGILLCHCEGGVSRSPAAALLCLATWTAPGRELECMDYVRQTRPCAMPHRDLLAFGDDLLGRQGRLLEAVGDIWPE